MHTYVVCEIGSNHDGDIDRAREMIRQAADCGADAVKFQIFQADTLYSVNTRDFDKYTNIYNMIKGLEVPLSFFRECDKICLDCNIEFLATPFNKEAVDFLVDIGTKKIKIASFEFTDARLVSYIAKTKLPILASTGLSSKSDIRKFMDITSGSDITLLHCNSAYPTPDEDVHLKAILYLFGFGTKVGYSDHSKGIVAPVIAVGMGACVIEKHFTLDRNRSGPDHAFAIEPRQFASMVRMIRQCEVMLGENNFDRSESEESMMYARRSIVADRFISCKKVIEEADITTKRPANGISAIKYFDIIGRRVNKDIGKNDAIKESDLI